MKHVKDLEVRKISIEAEVDPKTVRRLLDGRPVRDASRERILAAAKKLGIKLKNGGGR